MVGERGIPGYEHMSLVRAFVHFIAELTSLSEFK